MKIEYLSGIGVWMMIFAVKERQFLRVFLCLLIIYILPFILSDFYYPDDIWRYFIGNNWLSDGRIFTTLLFQIIGFSSKILDLSPLPHVLSIVLLAGALTLFYKHYLSFIPPALCAILCFLFIGSPFYLSNLSYQYDILTMSLSIALSILALIFSLQKEKIYLFYAVLTLTSSLLFYQATLMVFANLAILTVVLSFYKTQDSFSISRFYQQIFMAIVSFLLYSIVSKPFVSGYIVEHTQLIHLYPIKKLLADLYWDFFKIWYVVLKYAIRDIGFIFIVLIPTFISYVLVIHKSLAIKTNKTFISIGLFSLPFMILVTLFPMLIFHKPIIMSRVFLGFMPMMFFSWFGLTMALKNSFWRYLIVLPMVYCMTLSYSYNNLAKAQDRFDKLLAHTIVQDTQIFHLPTMNLLLVGDVPTAPEAKILIENKPILLALKRTVFSDPWIKRLFQYFPQVHFHKILFDEDRKNQEIILKVKKKLSKKPIMKENSIYTMKKVDDFIVIDFKNKSLR